MHPRALCERTEAADARIFAAVLKLAKTHELDAPIEALKASGHRDRDVALLQHREAIADLLDAVAAEKPVKPAEKKAEAPKAKPAGFPIANYDDLTAQDIKPLIGALKAADLDVVQAHEVKTLNRPGILRVISDAREKLA